MVTELKVLFLGLCMFVQSEQPGITGRTVVIPSIPASLGVTTRRGMTCVEPHVAYVAAAKTAVKECTSCELAPDGTKVMRLAPGDVLTIEGIVSKTYSEEPSFGIIPSMRSTCPEFTLAPIPPTAVTFAITAGTMTAEEAHFGERRSTLAVQTEGDITIKATRAGLARTMTLHAGATALTFGNQFANVFSDDPRPLADNHWLAFYTLAAGPFVCDLPVDDTPAAEHTHRPGYQTTIACSNSTYP